VTENSANPADVVEQEQDLHGDIPQTAGPVDIPPDANEADVLEQEMEVPQDDEEHRE
jgi:hypothetical protein